MPARAATTVNNQTKFQAHRGNLEDALRSVPWLARAGSAAIAHLAPRSRFRAYARGETVLRRGVAARHMVVLIEGKLETGLTSASGKRMVAGFIAPGTVVGLVSLFDQREIFQDAVAREPSLTVLVPRAAMLSAIREVPGFAEAVLRVLSQRMRLFLTAFADRSLNALRPRLAAMLLAQATQGRQLARLAPVAPAARSGAQGAARARSASRVVLTMSQEDLADMLGVTRQYLNTELKHLERSACITLGYRRVTLVDPQRLKDIAAGGA